MIGNESESAPAGKRNPVPGKRALSPGQRRATVDHQRSDFLRMCRARLRPEDVGLLPGRRARAGGLRREEVAALSGVSVSWYTWLEQGRDIRVSDEVLERVCQTFRLSPDERTYLFSLVQRRPPRAIAQSMAAPEDVVRMLDSLAMPGIVLNLRWDILAWNAMNNAIYRDYGSFPEAERNLLEILFTQPVSHMTDEQQAAMAQRLCARLRYDYSKHAGDPKFEALVRRLSAHSPLFTRFWRGSDFTLRAYGLHSFTHPRFGDLSFEHTSYVPDGHHDIRVVICTPSNDAAREALQKLQRELHQK